MILRPYQAEAVAAAWSAFHVKQDALIVMPPGMGKTEIAFGLMDKALKVKPDMRIVFALNRVKLLSQTIERASKVFSPFMVGEACGSRGRYDLDKAITVASIQTISRLDPGHVNLLIVDEAHRLNPDDESDYMRTIQKMEQLNPKLKIMGMTATPWRQTGYIYGEDLIFGGVTYEKNFREAIAMGFLVPPRMKKVNEQFDTSNVSISMGDFDIGELTKLTVDGDKVSRQIADAMPRLVGRKKVVWATTCIEHAELVRSKIPEAAAVIHSKQTPFQQDAALRSFTHGDVRHLVFVSIVAEGFDYPPIDAIVLMRPTRSPVLYVQIVGRGLRLYPEKTDCLVLDYGNIVMNCGPIDSPRIPKKGDRKGMPEIPMKFCPACFEYIALAARTCPACGYEFPKPEKTKNLTKQAGEGDILSDGKPKLIRIYDVLMESHHAKSGRPCIKVMCLPTSIFDNVVTEYATIGDPAEAWLTRKSIEKLQMFGLPVDSRDDLLDLYRELEEKAETMRPRELGSQLRLPITIHVSTTGYKAIVKVEEENETGNNNNEESAQASQAG